MQPGRIIGGKYRLRREIGSGAMGAVWAAVHEGLGSSVAVKFLSPTGMDADTAAARFVAEARMAAAVKHRFVVDIFDFGITEDGLSYMVLELLEGEDLGARMYYGPPMTVRDAVSFVCACLSGLDKVHEAGIVHRDLKPENIFVIQDADGPYPKLLDFGISKRDAPGSPMDTVSIRPPRMGGGRPSQLTLPGTVMGTPFYMSPEQLRGAADLDRRTDIYSMGIILWEWLVGWVPFDDDTIGKLLLTVLGSGPPDLAERRPELGEGLREVTRRALATRREDRYATAAQMRTALHRLLPDLPLEWTVVQRSVAEKNGQATVFASEAPTDQLPALPSAPLELPPLAPLGPTTLVDVRDDASVDKLDAAMRPNAAAPDTLREVASAATTEHAAAEAPVQPAAAQEGAGAATNDPAWRVALQRLTRAQRRPASMVAGAVGILLVLSLLWIWENPPEVQRETVLPSAEAQDAKAAAAARGDGGSRTSTAGGTTAAAKPGQPDSVVLDAGARADGTPGSGATVAITPDAGATDERPTRRSRRSKRRHGVQRRLYRSLDF